MSHPFPNRAGGIDAAATAVCDDPVPAAIANDLANLVARMGAPAPLDAREIVPDDMLRRLSRGDPAFDRGEIPADLAPELAMILPNVAAELLAYRAMADVEAARHARRRRADAWGDR